MRRPCSPPSPPKPSPRRAAPRPSSASMRCRPTSWAAFAEPAGYGRVPDGPAYVFDRRGHSVHTVNPGDRSVRTLVAIGGEPGRLLEPSAFDVAADGSFAVADAPGGRERIQVFGPAGIRIGGFTRAGRTAARVAIGSLVLSGVGSLVYTGPTVVLSGSDTGWLLTVHAARRAYPQHRPAPRHRPRRRSRTAPRAERRSRAPRWGTAASSSSSSPARRPSAGTSAPGEMMFERVIQGRDLESDPVAVLPQRWPPAPSVCAGGAAGRRQSSAPRLSIREGALWVSFVLPFTYVFDADGEKIRTVQFRAAGVVAPSSLTFPGRDRLRDRHRAATSSGGFSDVGSAESTQLS